jgi:hypothetical protein
MNTVPKIKDEFFQKARDEISVCGGEWLNIANKALELQHNAEQSTQQETYITAEQVTKAIEISLAEQQESEYITAAQAQHLGFGKVQVRQIGEKYWQGVTAGFYYSPQFEYRAIKQAQPQQAQWPSPNAKRVDPNEAYNRPYCPHAALRAEYAKQVTEGTTGFFKWEFQNTLGSSWVETKAHNRPMFYEERQYRYTDISCYVSKDGEPAIRMLRTEAQELQRKTKDTHDWRDPRGSDWAHWAFGGEGTYTYRTKATIKLGGNMVTPEQAAAEWGAKKETHDLWCFSEFTEPSIQGGNVFYLFKREEKFEYELRPKQPTWTDSRDDAIALLKEMELL